MLKIGIISPEFPPQIGGIETYAFEYTKALVKAGFCVTVFTRPQAASFPSIPGVDIVPALRRRRRADKRIIKDYSMDAWHVMNAAYAWIALETDKPVVISVHGNDFLRPYIPLANPDLQRLIGLNSEPAWLRPVNQKINDVLIKRYLEKSLPKAARILANSRYTESVFLRQYPLCSGKTSAAMVGVSEEFFDPIEKDDALNSPKRLISLSRLSEPRKNIDLIIKALARLKNEFEFTYTIIGDGSKKEELQTLAKDLGLEKQVEFTGFLSNEAIKKRLASSDLFILTSSVLPTSHEGFGIVYLEANACGTPVLACNQAGAAEAVADGVSGFTVPEPTDAAVTEALRAFLDNRIVFNSEDCQAFARSFSWEKVVGQAIPYYHCSAS